MTSQAYRYARLLCHSTRPGLSHLHPVVATVWISRPRTTNWLPGSCSCTIRIAMSPQRIRLRSLEIVWLIPSLDRGMPRYRGSRRSCPPIPGKTQSPADQLHPNVPSWQPCSLLGFVRRQGIVVWNPRITCASARPRGISITTGSRFIAMR